MSNIILISIAIVIIIVAGVIGYYLYAPRPTPPSQIVIGVTDKVTDMDPSNAYDFFTWEVLSNVMEGLYKYKPGTADLIPGIASSYEVRDNGYTWIFHLKTNVSFCDGTRVTAQNVVWSIKRVMTIKGDPSWLVTDFVDDVVALDNYTVEFKLKTPASYFLALVATPPYFPVHPNYPFYNISSDATWGGAGAYCIKDFKRDEYIILEANPYYHGEKPKTQRIIIKFYRDASSLRLALEKGEVDIAWRTLRPTDYVDLMKSGKYNIIEAPGGFIRYIVINVNMSPTNNILVRKAIAAAVNRSEIIEKVFMGMMMPLYSMVPNGMWSHIDSFKELYGSGPNISLARDLLRKAGYSETNKLRIELWYTPTHYGDTEADVAQLIKSQLEATGLVEVVIRSSEWATYVDQLRKGQMMVSLLGWYPDYIDPDDYLTPFLKSDANKWTGTGYKNPEVDRLLEEAQSIADQSKRSEIYERVQRILADEAPYIPLFQGYLILVSQKNVAGILLGPPMLLTYSTIYKT